MFAEQAAITNGKFDENGNAIVPKQATTVTPSQGKTKTKRNKGDRNTNVWVVPERSQGDNIDQLLAFIENTDTTKKANIINVNKNNLSVTERSKKEKKNAASNKKEVRLKKSTSMEELKSSSKMEEEIAQKERAQVSLRQKQLQQQQSAQKRNSTSDNKDLTNSKQSSSQAQPNKRGERRSWGTEELADFDAIDDRDTKKHKENKLNTKNNNSNNKKVEQVASTNASIESIPTNIEAAEFHVVTKKKKTKKRHIIEEAKAKQQQMHQRNDQGHTHGRHTSSNAAMSHKYQPSSMYTNDRDIYVNSIMAKENRRKSTSSVPPSDKSDSSDLDSVHSLPVESTTTPTSIISYAEIARKANQQQEKLSNVNAWPPMSHNGKISESPENSNTSTSSSTVSSKSQSSNRSYDTIKASSPSEERTTLNLDESRTPDTPKSQPPVSDVVKSQLQKSKSCDSEKYTTTMSLDQFPGLEKTVKPQKSHPNFASVLTSPPPSQPPLSSLLLTTSSTTNSANEKTTKGQATKKSPTVATAVAADINHPKENAVKPQKASDEKFENSKAAADVNHSKLVFVQNSAKAEEIANSDSSNLFVPITMKKTKKSQHNSNSMPANVSSKNSNGAQRTVS